VQLGTDQPRREKSDSLAPLIVSSIMEKWSFTEAEFEANEKEFRQRLASLNWVSYTHDFVAKTYLVVYSTK